MVIFSKMWCGNIQNKKIYRVFFGLVMMCAHSHRVNLRNQAQLRERLCIYIGSSHKCGAASNQGKS